MRTTLIPIAALLFSAQTNAQITAGEVPAGQSAIEVLGSVSLSTNFSSDSIGIELDCDDAMDAWAILRLGFPAVDAPNSAELRSSGSEIEVCMDLASGSLQRPRYYTFGQVLDCSGGFGWQSDASFTLGDLGGFGAIGPGMVDSLYIAYRQDGITGWIRLSFDLSEAEIDMQVHTVLSVCGGTTSIARNTRPAVATLHPNPSDGRPVRVESTKTIRYIELLDTYGRTIALHPGNTQLITPPDAAGTYWVRLVFSDDLQNILPLVRY